MRRRFLTLLLLLAITGCATSSQIDEYVSTLERPGGLYFQAWLVEERAAAPDVTLEEITAGMTDWFEVRGQFKTKTKGWSTRS